MIKLKIIIFQLLDLIALALVFKFNLFLGILTYLIRAFILYLGLNFRQSNKRMSNFLISLAWPILSVMSIVMTALERS